MLQRRLQGVSSPVQADFPTGQCQNQTQQLHHDAVQEEQCVYRGHNAQQTLAVRAQNMP